MSNNPIPPPETAGTPSSPPTPTPITTPKVSSKVSLGVQHDGPNNASCSPAPGSSTATTLTNTPAPVDFEALVAKQVDPNGDVKLKVHLITELREMIELCSRDVEFTKHLDIIILAVVEILSSTLMNLLIDMIRHDNEESVMICFKLVLRPKKFFIAERVQGPFIGVTPTITKAGKRSQHTELMIAQVTVMSFIAYVIRVQATLVQPFGTEIPTIVLRILKDIPPESSLSRRELIVALRHILGTEYRSLFIPFLNDLLNFRVFMGTGITSFETLPHLVYNTYTDLLQNIKSDLLGNHIKAILMNFAEVLNDPTASTTTQAMAGKVIYSLVNLVNSNRFKKHEGVRISQWLMENFVRKIEALADNRAYQIKQQADAQEQSQNSSNRLKQEPLKDKGKGRQIYTPGSSDPQSKSHTESGRLSPPDRTPEEAEDILIEQGKILGGVAAVFESPFDHSKGEFGMNKII
ncbi:hypothetical protein PGT21_011103 [Puccinia graminis f. sp. tritici]|uniref:Uncharacterized protein n=1 Tax=Puccinia graminis f. sp. tritici TaxID=56615 RepID=A0A5B0NXW5_PUCGR|nr:hypothetical protein PGT21_011103 [Puccinia graminis f. sp. tritici]